MKSITILSTMLILGLQLPMTTVLAEVAIIANPASGAGELDSKTAKKLFLGKIKTTPGMSSITLVGQADNSPVKAEFTKKVTKKDLSKYKAHWSKMIFSGKAIPPKVLANDEAVKAYVANHNDAVGYVDAGAVDDSVKILLRAP
ncbi:MAG: phosphate ABC transporter substrate-binding protein [Candidatus Thiodiazotropha sp. (ex Troendleina suluensis)]|nr:phosphate ABC transporter substrate-binding protein [Candidatus Thiodiazotropha sp. (ex Troendleina suluensis)]